LFLVCSRCGSAREVTDERVADSVARSASEAGFALESAILPEIEGVCPGCRHD
jgi:Fe2+ or Zn2+ uptake regulation protein